MSSVHENSGQTCNETEAGALTVGSSLPGVWAAVLGVLVVVGAGLSMYLTTLSLGTADAPGCGAGSGCAHVLSSSWSKFRVLGVGVPVAGMAVVVYAALGLCVGVWWRNGAWLAQRAACLLAGTVLGAAVWFMAIQIIDIGAICPYCTGTHAVGVVVGVLVLLRAGREARMYRWRLCALGVLAACVLAVLQLSFPSTLARLPIPTAGDYDVTDSVGRRVGVLNGQVRLDINNEMMLGDPDAETLVVLLFDYACPHCRHTHGVVQATLENGAREFAVASLPVPLQRSCNPHAREELPERFDDSCERTRVALAVFFAAPEQYPDFEAWMFETAAARTGEETRAEAASRLSEDVLTRAMADPRVEAALQRNIAAYGAAGGGTVPITVRPHVPAIAGRIEDTEDLMGWLQEPTPTQLEER